jgi:hypothetical protein
MRRRALVLGAVCCVSLVAPSAAEAQNGGLDVGVRGGLNLASVVAKVTLDGLSGSEGSPRRADLTAGVFAGKALTDRLGVQIEGLIGGRGIGGSGGLGVWYLDIPVLARVPITSAASRTRMDLVAGVTFGVRLTEAGIIAVEGIPLPLIDGNDLIRRLDTALTIGDSIGIGRFVIDVRYVHGLTNQFTPAGVEFVRDLLREAGAPFTTIDFSLQHRVFAFTVGYRFRGR